MWRQRGGVVGGRVAQQLLDLGAALRRDGSTQGLPIQSSLDLVGNLVAAEGDVADHAGRGRREHERDVAPPRLAASLHSRHRCRPSHFFAALNCFTRYLARRHNRPNVSHSPVCHRTADSSRPLIACARALTSVVGRRDRLATVARRSRPRRPTARAPGCSPEHGPPTRTPTRGCARRGAPPDARREPGRCGSCAADREARPPRSARARRARAASPPDAGNSLQTSQPARRKNSRDAAASRRCAARRAPARAGSTAVHIAAHYVSCGVRRLSSRSSCCRRHSPDGHLR